MRYWLNELVRRTQCWGGGKCFISLLLGLALMILGTAVAMAGTNDDLMLPAEFYAIDKPYDEGKDICLIWSVSPSDRKGVDYIIYESTSTLAAAFTKKMIVPSTGYYKSDNPSLFGFSKENKNYHYVDITLPTDEKGRPIKHYYKLAITDGVETLMFDKIATVEPVSNLFGWNKLNNLIILFLMAVFVIYFINRAKKNPNIFLRKIPGLEAVDEAVGRATEMGKPLLYLTGAYDMDDISTICSVNILRHVAKKVAQHDSRLIVPCRWSVAMTVCQEVVREAYINAGRPDAYNSSDIFYIAGEQFSFVAAVDGLMMRERPAANFFLGTFGGEALLLAEAGAITESIQIAGTDSMYQIPFFIAACDYCLIGEELYAASAYLSREPRLLGTLKGQDMGKIILSIAIIIATVLITINIFYPVSWFEYISQFLTVR